MLSLSGVSGSTGSGGAGCGGREAGGAALDSMEAAALGRHLAALREKLDDVCDEVVLVKVWPWLGCCIVITCLLSASLGATQTSVVIIVSCDIKSVC